MGQKKLKWCYSIARPEYKPATPAIQWLTIVHTMRRIYLFKLMFLSFFLLERMDSLGRGCITHGTRALIGMR
jgi:hypothetical protein